ncbi:MAG: phosphoribosylformylglycinamidine cyclo-ligase [Myxococcota bacterium]
MKKKSSFISYAKAGVSIERGDAFAEAVGKMAKAISRKEVVSGIGGFSALFALDTKRYPRPIICASTDGVGTKLKIAFAADKHSTVGIDLVAMSVNDLICSGAEPLFFLDYFATGRLEPAVAIEVMKGVIAGCKTANCALIGGETAEMPAMYQKGEYDLAGFAVGVVNEGDELPKRNIEPGDVLLGVPSTGVHSNGFSLVRKIVFEKARLKADSPFPGMKQSVAGVLLKPTKIYVDLFLKWRDAIELKALAHITGGGIEGNLVRVIPNGVKAVVNRASWRIPKVFSALQELGPVSEAEMFRTFNMGIGLIAVIPKRDVKEALKSAEKLGYKPHIIGEILKSKGKASVYFV